MYIDPVADIQNSPDWRNLAVNRVGVRGIRHPLVIQDRSPQGERIEQSVVARLDMLVDLPKNIKGTHMSRFLEILNEQETIISVENIPQWLHAMAQRLHANHSYFQAQFPYFINKQAPVSKTMGLLDYDVWLWGTLENQKCQVFATIIVPVTSLCPCSKEISKYGAHNQRSHVTVTVRAGPTLSLMEIIQLVESKASCELYSILKRADEKVVTERAYENPKFVEDMVRDIATSLEATPSVHGYKISSENFESIHNHSAYAEIDRLWANNNANALHHQEQIKELESALA